MSKWLIRTQSPVTGYFSNQPEINNAIAKKVTEKDAYSFFIIRQIDNNNVGNQSITAYVYKDNAPKHRTQNPDDSEASKAAHAAGSVAAAKVKISRVASRETPTCDIGLF